MSTQQQQQLTHTSSSSGLFSSLSYDSIDLSSNPIWFARLQEILLMHRPFDFCVLLAVIELIFGFIYFLKLGIFATIALLGLISYMLFIHYCHPNPIFEKIFFPPLKKPIDQTQPNRIRSYEEFSNFIASVHHGFQHYFGHKHLTGIKRIIFGVGSFIFALLLKRVVPFWVNFLLVHCILFLPLAILRPWPTKDTPGEEPKPEEQTPQTASQATSTAQSTLQAPAPVENNNSNSNQNSNDNSDKKLDENANNAPIPTKFREVVLEDTDEDPLRDASNTANTFSTPSSKSTSNSNNNSNGFSTPSSVSHVTPPISPSSSHPSTPKTPSDLPPIPPPTHPPVHVPPPSQPSTPKPQATMTSNPKVAAKAETVPKKKGLAKLKLRKGKKSKDETD